MTLACKCGSLELEFVEQEYPDEGLAYERYECASCGRKGSYRFGTRNGRTVDEKSGCLTTTFDQ
jgi:transposase-like protein